MYREINYFKNIDQPTANRVNDEEGDLVLDCHCILAKCRNYFSQQLKEHGDNDVMQTEIPTSVSLMPEPSAFEVAMATEKLKRHKALGTDQTPAGLVKAPGIRICSEIHKPVNFCLE